VVLGKLGTWFFHTYLDRLLRVLADTWTCSYPLIAAFALIALVFWTPQGPETIAWLHEFVLNVAQADTNTNVAVALTILGVAYCTIAIFVASVWALGRELHKAPGAERHKTSAIPYWLAFFCVLSAGGVIFGSGIALYLIVAAVVAFLVVPAIPSPTGAHGGHHDRLTGYALRAHGVLLAIGAVVVALTLFYPVTFPRLVTTWPVVYFAVGFWTLLGTLVAIAAPRRKWGHSLWLLPVLWVVFCSFFNDNHTLRPLPAGAAPAAKPKTMSRDDVSDWLRSHCPAQPPACTVRFIAAEGGGQRAAYWTQAVLTALDARDSGFNRSVFAFSGVSGGTLGGVSYYLAHETKRTGWQHRLQTAARADNLSPIIGALFTREVLQALWPWPIRALDRAHIYDEGLERTWSKTFTDRRDGTGMTNAFPQALPDAPAMFLNSARAETGERVVNSSLLLKDGESHDASFLADPRRDFDAGPMSTSTAVHLSSRFAFVNPHATIHYIPAKGGRVWGRLLDGGNFDNNGIITILEVMKSFTTALRECGKTCRKVELELVDIANDPNVDEYLDGTPAEAPPPIPVGTPPPPPTPRRGLWELVTPIEVKIAAVGNAAVSGQRSRIRDFIAETQARTGITTTFRVISLSRLIRTYNAVPIANPVSHWCSDYATWKPALGWWLSEHSRRQMDTLIEAKLPDGRTLLDTTQPGQHARQSDACSASAAAGKN
jgi:hypothetical protein